MIRCYVTDRRAGDVVVFAKRAIDEGVDLIQIREKDLAASALLELVCRVRDLAASTKTRVLVNDRVDIAMAASVGVQLPENGLPAHHVRPLVRLVGVSTHSPDSSLAAEKAAADFIVFGPIFDTPGKTAVGLPALRSIASSVKIPVLAIGGITRDNVPLVIDAGAAGFAAIRMFQRL